MIEQEKIPKGIDPDDFLFRLIEAGHTAIFQWIAVYVASGIGFIQMIIEILKYPKIISFNLMVYGIIYFVLISLMTLSVYSILNIMHHQNGWIEQLEGEKKQKQKDLFYKSRSPFSILIVGTRDNLSTSEWLLICGHFLLLFFVGMGIWLLNVIVTWLF